MSALLQLHLHSPLNTWPQYIAQRQLQAKMRKFKFWYLVPLILEILQHSLLPLKHKQNRGVHPWASHHSVSVSCIFLCQNDISSTNHIEGILPKGPICHA